MLHGNILISLRKIFAGTADSGERDRRSSHAAARGTCDQCNVRSLRTACVCGDPNLAATGAAVFRLRAMATSHPSRGR